MTFDVLRRIWVVALCRLLMAVGFSLSFPFLALYLNKERGVPMPWVGSFLALSVVASALFQTVGGNWADRYGRKPIMVYALLARILAVAALAWALGPRWEAPFLVIAFLHLLSSAIGGIYDPASAAWVSDQFSSSERVGAFGLLRTAGNLGWAVGPAIGGLAIGARYQGLFFGTAAMFSVCAVLLAAFVAEPRDRAPVQESSLLADLGLLGDERLRRFLWGTVLMGLVFSQLIAPLSLYTRFAGISERQLGLIFSLNGALVVLLQVPVIRALSGWTLPSLLAAGAAFYAAGYSAIAFLDGFGPILGATAVVTLGEIILSPALPAFASNLAPAGQRGRYLGLEGFAHHVGWAMGPLAAGWGLEFLGRMRPCPYWLAVGLAALAATRIFLSLPALLLKRPDAVPVLSKNDIMA